MRRSKSFKVSSLTEHNRKLQSFDKSSDVILFGSSRSLIGFSILISQNRIFLSKWALIMDAPILSVVTKSKQLEPTNFVSIHAELRTSQTLSVLSWLPDIILYGSWRYLAAITFSIWPVRVCCGKEIVWWLLYLICSWFTVKS